MPPIAKLPSPERTIWVVGCMLSYRHYQTLLRGIKTQGSAAVQCWPENRYLLSAKNCNTNGIDYAKQNRDITGKRICLITNWQTLSQPAADSSAYKYMQRPYQNLTAMYTYFNTEHIAAFLPAHPRVFQYQALRLATENGPLFQTMPVSETGPL